MPRHRFELAGGDPALDFLNTIHDWNAAERIDYLSDATDAGRFGRAAGLLSATEARRLGGLAHGGELRRLRSLRARLERIFRAQVRGRAPAAADLDRLGLSLVEAARATRYRGRAGRAVGHAIDGGAARSGLLRLRIAAAAARLLTGDQMRRVKDCPACGWFFLDASKNGSRRWCSMTTCGASAKAKRYYRRRRGLPGG